ncbi:hypothetical protein [Sulfuracidifex tepidarius]|uniref:Uncharacterized protein n=1 Tax=Sulfuracidifex tepidarius TaxID=1294262 RepID=A0A510E1R3_9CREN|nr:hypothetical protein [Sulfuracidifex tepidarius]BBG23679.1 hypothetical protein IC006_0967 [Sulfuracidifex tepidarius]BBG26431.1 hypothetical protein IC007_0939 [Sulfuracidifex tepidarius]
MSSTICTSIETGSLFPFTSCYRNLSSTFILMEEAFLFPLIMRDRKEDREISKAGKVFSYCERKAK